VAHELLQDADGRFAMAYRAGDELPWHARETFPQTFEPGASPTEIADAALLNYDVQLAPNCFADGSPIPDSFHISRVDDPTTVYGRFVAGDWQPVQNSSALELAALLEAEHGFQTITAGAIFGGSKVFVQLENGNTFTLPGNDTLVSRLLITVSHLGLEANKFVGCNTRAVCNNTIRAATSEGAGIVSHDHRVEFDHDAIVTAIGLNAESFADFAELAQRMAEHALSDSAALDYFRAVLGGKQRTEDDGRVIDSIAVRKAFASHRGEEFVAIGQKPKESADVALYVADRLDAISRGVATELPSDVVTESNGINPGRELESAQGTLWGAFNTLTWSADHNPTKDRGTSANLASNLLGEGTGGRLKARAVKVATELLAA
jgi:hypothetical protein